MSSLDFTEILPVVREHAAAVAPRECCGVVIIRKGKLRYKPCQNLYGGAGDIFWIDPVGYADAEDEGDVVAIVHSHVNLAPIPSVADKVGIEGTQLPWLIVNHPVGHFTVTEPSGFAADLVGRPFVHGVLDCYNLIRDYYARERGVTLPDYERPELWWELDGYDLYEENFGKAGFVKIDEKELAEGDVILMSIAANRTNHGAVYVGNNRILQHCIGRLSSRDVWGGAWRKAATHYLRYVGAEYARENQKCGQ